MEPKPTYTLRARPTPPLHSGPFFIGLNPSLRCTALVVLDTGDAPLLSHTIHTAPNGVALPNRLNRFAAIIDAVATKIAACGAPELIAIAGYHLRAANAGSAARVELGALLRHTFFARGWPTVEVPPVTLKRFALDMYAVGAGNADKAAVFGQQSVSADEAWPTAGWHAYGLVHIARCLRQPNRYAARFRQAIAQIAAPGAHPKPLSQTTTQA